jgi:hypothetical protein
MNTQTKQKLSRIFNIAFVKSIIAMIIFFVTARAPISETYTYTTKDLFVMLTAFFTVYNLDRWEDSSK